jgi:ABC-2 type transport system permease protein
VNRRFLARAYEVLAVRYNEMVEYRAELILWVLVNSLSFILMGVWYEAAKRGTFAAEPIHFVRYFLAVFLVRQLSMVWVIWEFEQELLKGKLGQQLVAPIDPVWRHVAAHIAERIARIPFTILLTALFFLLYPKAFFVPSARELLSFVFFCTTAFAMRFLIQYTLAMLAFWTERASSAESLFYALYMILAGGIAPLDVWPPALRHALEYTPFPYMIFVPANVLTGGTVDWGMALPVLAGWSLLLFILNRALWRVGLRRFAAMGA